MSFQRINVDSAAQDKPAAKPSFRSSADPVAPPPAPVVKSSERSTPMKSKAPMKMIAGIGVAVVVAGLLTGYAAAIMMPGSEPVVVAEQDDEVTENQMKVGAVFGVADEKTFRDETEGVLIKGGLEGEGSHTLLREGGISQNVYLTSSVVDLDQFDGMTVKVWGETFKGQKAGWLMDVGRLEINNLKGEKPEWYTTQESKTKKNTSVNEE